MLWTLARQLESLSLVQCFPARPAGWQRSSSVTMPPHVPPTPRQTRPRRLADHRHWSCRSSRFGAARYPDPETDPAQYAAILATWQPTGLVRLFPATIPPDAQAVRFSAFPGAGQGGPWIELRLKLPGPKVAAIEAAARRTTKHAYSPDHEFTLPATGDNWQSPSVISAMERPISSSRPHR